MEQISLNERIAAFWQWSCQVYQYSDVRKLCLELQDHYQLNVNYLLLSIWAEQQSIDLSPESWQKVRDKSENILNTIAIVRAKRLIYKEKDRILYEKLLEMELEGERLLQRSALITLSPFWQSGLEKLKINHNLQVYVETVSNRPDALQEAFKLGYLVQNLKV